MQQFDTSRNKKSTSSQVIGSCIPSSSAGGLFVVRCKRSELITVIYFSI